MAKMKWIQQRQRLLKQSNHKEETKNVNKNKNQNGSKRWMMDSPSGSTGVGSHPRERIIFLLARLSLPLLSDTYFLSPSLCCCCFNISSSVAAEQRGRDHFGSSRCVMCPRESPLDFAVLTMIDRGEPLLA